MPIYPIDDSQRKAAKVVGAAYLITNALCIFAQFHVRSNLIVWDNAAKTAANIMASERLFRLGIASELAAFAGLVVLVAGLYVILKPVNRNLALLAAFWRLIEISLCVVMTLGSLDALQLLSRANYLQAFEANRLQALTMLSIGAHDTAYSVGIFFFGLGSTVFSYLWVQSRYIPKALAVWGVFSSGLCAMCTITFIVFPKLDDLLDPGCYMPILIFETALPLWLLFKGLPSIPARCD